MTDIVDHNLQKNMSSTEPNKILENSLNDDVQELEEESIKSALEYKNHFLEKKLDEQIPLKNPNVYEKEPQPIHNTENTIKIISQLLGL